MSSLSWNELNIEHLLELREIEPGYWRAYRGDPNLNGRSYGGQLLAQAMTAGMKGVPDARQPTMMQSLFVQGAMPQHPLDLQVTPLQDGKRFSSRHVRASQGNGRVILDAQVTCAVALESPSHETPSGAPVGERPEELSRFADLDPALYRGLDRLGGYSEDRKPSIEFRIPDPARQFSPDAMDGRFRFWMRATHALPDDPRIHAAAFAFMSDWWVNFCTLGLHLNEVETKGRRLYISSLNHAIWLHQRFRVDRWMHVDTRSPASGSGRGFCTAAVHDREGRAVASMTQECLMVYADSVVT